MLLQVLQQLSGENHNMPIMSPAAVVAPDMTALERQIARVQSQQQRQQLSYFAATNNISDTSTPFSVPRRNHILPPGSVSLQTTNFCGEQGVIRNDLPIGSVSTVWPDLAHYPMHGASFPGGAVVGDGGGTISTTFSCPPVMGEVESRGRAQSPPASQFDHASTLKDVTAAAVAVAALSADRARESSKRRKSTDRAGAHKLEDDREKKIKLENTDSPVSPKVESPSVMSSPTAITANNSHKHNNCREASSSASKEKSKAPEPPPKTDYIHVRARRGQATDSHSLAERVRREKISERMKLLQDLVPGCNKITGKAGMLDEIINYVQSLQRQVEFLSMKLAAVTPALDFNLDTLLTKEMIPASCGVGGFPAAMGGIPPELLDLSFLQFTPLQQQAAAGAAECCELPVPMAGTSSRSPAAAALCRIATSPVSASAPSSFRDSCDLVHPPSATPGWDSDLQRFFSTMEFEQGRLAAASPATSD